MTINHHNLGDLISPAAVDRAGTGDYPILSMTMHRGLVLQGEKFKKRIASADTSAYKVVKQGQLVVGFPIDEGVLAFQEVTPIGIVSPAYDIWNIKNSHLIQAKYLERFLRSPIALSYYRSKLRSTTARRRSLPQGLFLTLQVPILEIGEQKRVTNILDQVDSLREKRIRAIDLIDDLAKSIFLDMFGNMSSKSETVSVGDLATNVRTGPFGSDLLHSEFVDDGIAVLGIDNTVNNEFTWSQRRFITEEKYQKLARYRVHAGDLLITIMGTCGRCAIVPDDIPVAINTKHLCCITLDKSRCLPDFLHAYFLMHPTARRYLERTAKGAVMSGLNATIIKSLPVQLPPFADQERFAKTSLQLREQKRRLSGQAHEIDELSKSLQQRAFRNEL